MYLLLLGCFCAIFVLITCKDNNVYWKQKIHVPNANHVSVYLNNKVKEDIFVIVNYFRYIYKGHRAGNTKSMLNDKTSNGQLLSKI